MYSRRSNLSVLGAAILAGASMAQPAAAVVTISVIDIPLAGNIQYGTVLNNNGWTSLLVVATADSTSKTVGGFDFFTPAGTGQNTSGNVGFTGKNWGIFGTFDQDWSPSTKAGTVQTPVGDVPTSSPFDGFDSYFNNFSAALSFTPHDAAIEDNNLVTVPSNDPLNPASYSGSPDVNDTFDANGVGTFLRADGSFTGANKGGQSVVLAYLIVPWFAQYSIEGIVMDGTAQGTQFPVDISGTALAAPPPLIPIPEPATLALIMAGLFSLTRRRCEGGH